MDCSLPIGNSFEWLSQFAKTDMARHNSNRNLFAVIPLSSLAQKHRSTIYRKHLSHPLFDFCSGLWSLPRSSCSDFIQEKENPKLGYSEKQGTGHMTKRANRITTIALAITSLALLIPSVTFGIKDGLLFDNSPSWKIDLKGITQKSIDSLGNRIQSTLSDEGPFRLSSFFFTFSDSGDLRDGLAFFQLAEEERYQFKVEDANTTGEVRKRGKEYDELKIRKDITSEIFSVIEQTQTLNAQEKSYESQGIYTSQGQLLSTGISKTIKNYILTESKLNPIESLPKEEKFFQITCTSHYQHEEKITANFFISC